MRTTSIETSTMRSTSIVLMSIPSGYKETPPPLQASTTNVHVDRTIQNREIIAWCLAVLLTILTTGLLIILISITIRNIYNRKRNARRKETQTQEDELEDNQRYGVTKTRPSLLEVMENPCYRATTANRLPETQSAVYESIKLDRIYVNTNR